MHLLTRKEILFLDKNNISRFGGNFVPPDNLLHETSLDYLVEIVDAELFGETMYPEIYHKAGVYHFKTYFTDGNKRTGLDACILFFEFNGYQLSETVSNQILTDFILSVASGRQSLESVQSWLKENSIKKPTDIKN